jgi:dipeptidyl aminopeptidase/acylaminoacyl peptidase
MSNSSKIHCQFGLWDSPISPISLARGKSFTDVAWDHDGTLVWREGRSDQGVLVLQSEDGQAPRDLNNELSVRAKVGYGGGDFTAGQGNVFFAEAESGRIFRQPLKHGIAKSITPAFGQFASPSLSPDGKWLLFIHTYEGEDSLGIIDTSGETWPRKLVSGDDFYMQPSWHPDGNSIAWITWNHPNMPWDGTILRKGKLRYLSDESPILTDVNNISGTESISIFQPEFSPDGRHLAYVSDASGWWQIYLLDMETDSHCQLTSDSADYGIPAWVQGLRTYSFSPDGKYIFCIRNQAGVNSLWKITVHSGERERVPLPKIYTELRQIAISPKNDQIALIASGAEVPQRVITYSQTVGVQVMARSRDEALSPSFYSTSQAIKWQGMDGQIVHGLFYEPHNPESNGIGKPPLIVNIHGGPTSQRGTAFNIQAQFFTSRGYAYLDVNYRGSTGYGRPYWESLKGSWGIYDVQDAVSGAKHLVEQYEVDGDRLVIMGGSAGGFTVLKTLEDHPGFFKAGICLYGVANQFTLAADTHKFEAHYSDTLLGSLPEASDLYYERSPIFHVNKIQDPIAVFQGEEDRVVPRSQSDEIVSSLMKRGIPHEYHLYPGEGHGFRKIETLEHFYKAVEKFLKYYVIYS